MKKSEKSLKQYMIFLLIIGFGQMGLNGENVEPNTIQSVISLICFILPVIVFISLKKHSKKSPLYCKIVGLLELIFSLYNTFVVVSNWDSLDSKYSYPLIGVCLFELLIGMAVIIESNKLKKELNN